MDKLIKKINDAPIRKWEWVTLFVMLTFIFFTIFYEDLIIIYDHSLTFLDSLFTGDIANFYANTMAKPSYGFGAVYFWVPYLVEGIWSLPLYIMVKLSWIPQDCTGVYIWLKLGICLMLWATTWILGDILKRQGHTKEQVAFARFFFLSGLLVVMSTVAVAQIDIIVLFFILLGLREYAASEKVTWKFLLIFSFAATIKTFALFVFLPLVFLKEKRILNVVWNIFCGLIGVLLCVLPYGGREDYKESTAILNDVMIERLFKTVFPAGNVKIPIFIAVLIALCIWCYVQNVKKEELQDFAMYIALFVFADFFIFVFVHPYWIVLLAPFLTYFVARNADGRKLNVILELILSVAAMFVYCTKFGVFITEKGVNHMILPLLGHPTNGTGYSQSSEWIVAHGLDFYVKPMFAVFAVCLIAFVIMNYPRRYADILAGKKEEGITFDHGMIYVRLLGVLGYIATYMYLGYIA